MLEPVKHLLSAQRLVLASGSARRREILNNIGLNLEIFPSTFEENLDKKTFEHPFQYALATARHKALEVANRLAAQQHPPHLIVGADTVISLDGDIIEKPADRQHAINILKRFSGRKHAVYTGVILLQPKETPGGNGDSQFDIHEFYEKTEVKFADISEDIIAAYVDTGESFDKAGGYGIQGIGGTLIEGIEGDYFNVMGFPLHKFCKELHKLYTQSS